MHGTRSFRQRIFLAILLVALLPAAAAVAVGTFGLRELGSTVGTLGPWDAVAGSGQDLIEAARAAAPGDSTVVAAAEAHREALSRSVRWSRFSAFVTGRFVGVLPWLAAGTAAVIALLSFLTARWLSRGFGEPIQELVGWTDRIARGEPLPDPEATRHTGVEEFSALRASLRRMADDLERARRREVEAARLTAWTEMARRVAHELKNPLTPMRMAATSLAMGPDSRQAETGRMLLDEIGRLDEMARTFSQFGRMPEGPPSEVDVPELLRSLADRHDTEELPVVVRCVGEVPRIHAHLEVLTRAFRNLLLNALEAVGSGGSPGAPAVELRADRVAAGVRVRVRDRGPGVPEDLLDRIWHPDVTTKRRGTGLGLALVRQAVEAHGGSVSARNAPEDGYGAEFEVIVPLALPDAVDRETAPDPPT